jgi:V-type H+-transporting ATPase subunit a
MVHKKIRIPRESANEIMRALGNLKASLEFDDLTKDDIEARKSFGDMIKRCEDIKKKIYDYTRICYDFHLPFNYYKTYEEFHLDITSDMTQRDKKLGSTYFDLIENEIIENDKRINELVDSHSQIREDLVSLIEKKHVLFKAEELIRTNLDFSNFSEAAPGENGVKQGLGSNLNFMAGVVNTEHEMKMKRMIFRISRGRAITAYYPLEINNDEYLLTSTVRQRGMSLSSKGNLEKLSSIIQSKDVGTINTQKKIFTIIFTGSEENVLLQKLLKVCEVFQASRYPVPKNSEVRNAIRQIEKEILDKKNLLVSLEKNLQDFCLLSNSLGNKKGYKYSLYKLYFDQEKMIYTTLNKCIIRDTFVDGQVWIPANSVPEITNLLQNIFRGHSENKTSAYLEDLNFEEDFNPPTLIQVNEFTSSFQQVVDTYGIPRYREVNPGYFTIITFPFLFAVMFGDIGHGSILFIFALYLCIFNKSIMKSKSILSAMVPHRYFFVLMGFFALYCGLLYNDFLSIPVYFKSCYHPKKGQKGTVEKEEKCKYGFGLDPVWYTTTNELAFVNSLKMKLSVILGVFQMVIGIILKGINCIFERDFVELIFVFFPQIILMLILFGYMDFLIFVKWSTEYPPKKEVTIDNQQYIINANSYAPDIKSYLMNIFLHFGKLPEEPKISISLVNNVTKEYKTDWKLLTDRPILEKIHLWILITALICMITMFLPKILINYSKSKKKAKKTIISEKKDNRIIDDDNDNQGLKEELINPKKEEQGPSFSDFFVASAIETIEFVLGTVSNTASYLRLWALSLAHSQLALVFFQKTLGMASTKHWWLNAIILTFMFPAFSGVTTIVLLFMDMMECFLHTLRLHWVEFQNKFYKADGYKFTPFSFSQNLCLNEDEFID